MQVRLTDEYRLINVSAYCQRHFGILKCSWCWIASSYVSYVKRMRWRYGNRHMPAQDYVMSCNAILSVIICDCAF